LGTSPASNVTEKDGTADSVVAADGTNSSAKYVVYVPAARVSRACEPGARTPVPPVTRARLCKVGRSLGSDLDALSANDPLPDAAGTVTVATVASPRVGNVVVLAVVANGTVAVTVVAGTAVGAGEFTGRTLLVVGPHAASARVSAATSVAGTR